MCEAASKKSRLASATRSTYRRPVEPAQLDPELLARTEDRYAGIREGAVQELAALLAAGPSVALAARHALLRMTSDDSRRVSARAQAALEAAEDAERAAGEAVERPPGEGDEAAERPPADAAEPPVAVPPPAVPPPAVPPEARLVAPPARRGPRRVIAAAAALAVIALAVVLVLIVGGGDGGGGDGGESPIPAGNFTTNPSFESDTAGWDVSTATIATERTRDAPDGEHVVRVRALTRAGDFAIDDSPDTIQSSVAGRRYTAAAWVKATESTNGELICIGLRERAVSDGESVSDSYAAGIATVGEFREVGTFLVAEGTGNRISVHVFMDREEGGEGDAFLADAISIAERPGGATSGGGC